MKRARVSRVGAMIFCACRFREAAMVRGAPATLKERYAAARRSLDNFLARGVLVRDSRPGLLRLPCSERPARSDRNSGCWSRWIAIGPARCARHELTRPDKETDRARLIQALEAQTGLVMLAHRPTRRSVSCH